MIINFINVFLNSVALFYTLFKTDIKNLVLFVEAFQLTDIIMSKSNPLIILTQTCAKCIVTYYGQTRYLHYLAFVWSFSDFIRYMYHIFPDNKLIKTVRYSQYRILYPIGIGLEIATIIPVLSYNYQIVVGLLYVIVFPYMFNHG